MSIDIIPRHRPEFEEVIAFLKDEIKSLRTGRANPSLVDEVSVEAYGSRQGLVGLASITTPDARTIIVEPWDKSILKDIERGITEAKLGLNPVVQGQLIRIVIPSLTEETRKNLIKLMGERLEHARVGVRSVRDKVKAEIQKAEKDKSIGEDEKFRMLEQLDRVAAGFNEQIKTIGEEKEKEIMTI